MRQQILQLAIATSIVIARSTGQTQVDLRTQSKSVDFSGALSTKPFQTGASLPATCGVGQMFFVTTASGGQNTYGCTSPGIWTLQSGGSVSPTTVDNSGVPVGTRPTLDFSAGTGLTFAVSDTGREISVQTLLDTTVAQTLSGEQSGSALLCNSGSAASVGVVFVCAMTPALTAYSPGMVFNWIADVNSAGGSTTLNVDSLGAIPIKHPDGVTDPAYSDILAGQLYPLWYDGSVFRIVGGSGASGSGSTGPAGPPGPQGPAGSQGPVGPAGSNASGVISPGGYFFPFGFPTDNGSTSFSQSEIVKAHMFVANPGMTVAGLAYSVVSVSGCSAGTPCGLVWGIYTQAGALVSQQVTSVTGSGAGWVSFGSPAVLSAGNAYYLAYAVDRIGISFQAAGSGSWLFHTLANDGITVRSGTAGNSASGSGSALALPSALGLLTAAGGGFAVPPVVAFLM